MVVSYKQSDKHEGGRKAPRHYTQRQTPTLFTLLTDVFFLELSRQVSLDKGGLADATVADQDKLELRDGLCGWVIEWFVVVVVVAGGEMGEDCASVKRRKGRHAVREKGEGEGRRFSEPQGESDGGALH